MRNTNVTKYNFEALKERFWQMSEHEILKEYTTLCNQYNQLMSCDDMSLVDELAEDIISARDYLGHYIAQSHCHELGYEI